MTESNSHDAVVNLRSKTMNIKNLKKMSRTFHEIFLLGRILPENFFSCKILARCLAEKCIILQDLERKSCKILARNAFFFNQGLIRMINNEAPLVENECIPCKDLARSLQKTHALQDLARKFFSCKILQGNLFHERSCKEIFFLARCLAEKCINLQDLARSL